MSVSTYRCAVVFVFVVFVAPADADDDGGGGAYNPYGIGAANAARVVDVSAASAMNRREIDDGASSTTCPTILTLVGVRGIILQAFGVGNFPAAWLEFLTAHAERGLRIYSSTQCESGDSHPELHASGRGALNVGAKSASLTRGPECAVVKAMLALEHESVDLKTTVVGEA